MGIDRVGALGGRLVLIPAEATDTERALQRGDGILGWEGDPNMEIAADLDGNWWVTTLDAEGNRTPVIGPRSYCDQRLVADVIHADTRRFDVAGRVLEHNRRLDDAKRAERRAANDERADRLHHALLRDIGAYHGGLTRRVY
jgi:hypothetical protein